MHAVICDNLVDFVGGFLYNICTFKLNYNENALRRSQNALIIYIYKNQHGMSSKYPGEMMTMVDHGHHGF